MPENFISQLNEFSVIKLSGEETLSFLQGQVTCDMTKLKGQKYLPGCHCNAKGKMWSSFIALPSIQEGTVYLVMTKESAQSSLAELNKYGVFAKTEISDDTDNWFIYGANSIASNINPEHAIKLAENHYLLLTQTELGSTQQETNVWWQDEILSGRAHIFEQTSQEYVPQMLNMQALDYISFQKGCYMGQEMVARMRYLGKNKRALYIAETSSEIKFTPGTDVAIEINGNKRNIGKVIQSQAAKSKTIMQLVLPKDTELSETLYIDQETKIKLLELPYSLD